MFSYLEALAAKQAFGGWGKLRPMACQARVLNWSNSALPNQVETIPLELEAFLRDFVADL
jgi:hypothetical protein